MCKKIICNTTINDNVFYVNIILQFLLINNYTLNNLLIIFFFSWHTTIYRRNLWSKTFRLTVSAFWFLFTSEQLKVLSSAKTWYLDGIFKVVKSPFVQMFSIHAFITSDNSTTQVPLAFCMMSRRLTSDYKAVSFFLFCFFFFTNCKNYIRHFQLYRSEKHQHVACH